VKKGMAEVRGGWSEKERHRRMVAGHPERVEVTVIEQRQLGWFPVNKLTDII